MKEKPRLALCDLITEYGYSLVNDRGRLSGLLRDLCENECKAEISLFLTALDDGVAEELLAHSKSTAPNLLISRLAKRLQEDRLLTEEAARWVVESLALALGVVEEAELSRAKRIIPPASFMPLPSMPASSAQSPPIVPNQHLSSPSSSTQPLPMPQTSHVWKGLAVITLLIIGGAFIKNGLDKAEQARLMENDRIRAEATRESEKSKQEMERAKQELEQTKRDEEHWQKQAELEKQHRLAEIERIESDLKRNQSESKPQEIPPPIPATAEKQPKSLSPAPLHPPEKTKGDYYIQQMLNASAHGDEAKIMENLAIVQSFLKPERGNKKIARELNAQGLEYINLEQYDQAVEKLYAAHRADIGDVEIANNLGYALFKKGTLGEAKTVLVEALTLNPGRTNAWMNLGQVLAVDNDINAAVACLDNAYRFSKNPPKTHELFLAIIKQEENANIRAALEQATQKAVGKFVAVP